MGGYYTPAYVKADSAASAETLSVIAVSSSQGGKSSAQKGVGPSNAANAAGTIKVVSVIEPSGWMGCIGV